MYNLIEYSDNYSKKSGSLRHYCRDEPLLNANGAIAGFPPDNNNSSLFKLKTIIARRTGNDGTKIVKIRVPLKYLCIFWRTLRMPLINCKINFVITWSNRCFIIDNTIADHEPTFAITDMKLCVPFLTLSTPDSEKLLEQLKSSFK